MIWMMTNAKPESRFWACASQLVLLELPELPLPRCHRYRRQRHLREDGAPGPP